MRHKRSRKRHAESTATKFFGARRGVQRDQILRRAMSLEKLECRRLLTSDWQNPINQLDVNNDQFVAPNDVLVLVNELNATVETRISGPNGELPIPDQNVAPPPFLDVNGDTFLAPNDVLLIINVLNQEFTPPVVTVGLVNDTAPDGTNADSVTSDPRLTGTATANSGILKVEVSVDGGPRMPTNLDPSGRFTFSPSLALDGSQDGPHTMTVKIDTVDPEPSIVMQVKSSRDERRRDRP